MMKIQCPHCSTGYTISEKELQLSKGAVQCGKCMNTFDANQSIIEEEPVFDHSSAFIEPLSSNEISQYKQGLRLDDLVPDSSAPELMKSQSKALKTATTLNYQLVLKIMI